MQTLSRDILIAAKFAGVNTARETLTCVYIDNNKLVATNGYSLVEIQRKGFDLVDFPIIPGIEPLVELEKPILLKADQLLKKLKFPKNRTLPMLETAIFSANSETTISLTTTDLETANTVQFKKHNAEFPKYESIIPTETPRATLVVDAKLLIECLGAFIDGGHNSVSISIFNTDKALMLTGLSENNKHIKALLMPLNPNFVK